MNKIVYKCFFTFCIVLWSVILIGVTFFNVVLNKILMITACLAVILFLGRALFDIKNLK